MAAPSSSTAPVAVILAAGVGRRLAVDAGPHKILLTFGGRTLLERHLRALRSVGVDEVWITIGHAGDAIRREVASLGRYTVRLTENPDYHAGSLLSLWLQRERLLGGRPLILMDGDLLYEPELLRRLLEAPGENALLTDREPEPGGEVLHVNLDAGGRVRALNRDPLAPGEHGAEAVGMFRFSAQGARDLAQACERRMAQDGAQAEYEAAIHDLVAADPSRFAAVDVTDLAWTEIDFEADVDRARDEGPSRRTAPGLAR